MKKLIESFKSLELTNEQMKKVNGGGGCFDGYYPCIDECNHNPAMSDPQDLHVCFLGCWGAAVSSGCNEL